MKLSLDFNDTVQHTALLCAICNSCLIVDKNFNLVFPAQHKGSLFSNHPHLYPHREKLETVLRENNSIHLEDVKCPSPKGLLRLMLKIIPLIDEKQQPAGLLISIEDQSDLNELS